MSTIAEYFEQSSCPIMGHSPRQDTGLIVGVECEIESIKSYNDIPLGYFNVTEDGSLRNGGREFVSIPLMLEDSVKAFTNLHATLKLSNKDEAFSNRTSIHVHANCRNLELETVRTILLLYALYEEAFFLMVTPERRDNIHCVPLTETFLSGRYKVTVPNLVENWHKYTALNLKPLAEYGTIEFRHMQGHNDPDLYAQWLSSINGLFEQAKVIKTLHVGIVDDEGFLERMFINIFGKTHIANHWTGVRGLMTNSILDVKLGL